MYSVPYTIARGARRVQNFFASNAIKINALEALWRRGAQSKRPGDSAAG